MCISVLISCLSSAHESQKSVLDPQRLEIQLWATVWVLEIETGSFGRLEVFFTVTSSFQSAPSTPL